VTGEWETQNRGGYGPSFLIDTSKGSSTKTVRFSPKIIKNGSYDVYVYFSKAQEATSQTSINISDGKTEKKIMVKEADIRVEGQTSGEWVSMGSYTIEASSQPYVLVSNEGADGTVVADAVLWVPQR
jgi:hypothetical protein